MFIKFWKFCEYVWYVLLFLYSLPIMLMTCLCGIIKNSFKFLSGNFRSPSPNGHCGITQVQWAFQLLIVESAALFFLLKQVPHDIVVRSSQVTIQQIQPEMTTLQMICLPQNLYSFLAFILFIYLWLIVGRPMYGITNNEKGWFPHYYDPLTIRLGILMIAVTAIFPTLLVVAANNDSLPGQIKRLESSRISGYQFTSDKSKGIRLEMPFEIIEVRSDVEVLGLRLILDPVLATEGWYVASASESGYSLDDYENPISYSNTEPVKSIEDRIFTTISVEPKTNPEGVKSEYIKVGDKYNCVVLLKHNDCVKTELARSVVVKGLQEKNYTLQLDIYPDVNEQ